MATEADLDRVRQRIIGALDRLDALIARRRDMTARVQRVEAAHAALQARYDLLEAHARSALADLDRLLGGHEGS